MIDGRLYAPGQRLKLADAAFPPCTLAAVEPYKVLLDVQGKRVELVYENRRQAEPQAGPLRRAAPSIKPGPSSPPTPTAPPQGGAGDAAVIPAHHAYRRRTNARPALDRAIAGRARDAGHEEARRAPRGQAKDRSPLEAILVKKGLASEEQIAAAYARYLMVPLMSSAAEGELDPSLAGCCPKSSAATIAGAGGARRRDAGRGLRLAGRMLVVDELQLLTGMTDPPADRARCRWCGLIEALYSGRSAAGVRRRRRRNSRKAEEEEQQATAATHDDEILELDRPPPPGQDGRIIRMVNQILEQALRIGASDIHLEPFEDSCAIRLRVDGVLRELTPPSRSLFVPIVSRFKILAKMDIAEKRVPQDGAIALKSGDKRVDLRVSTVPTVYGEKMVMRILDKGAIPIELTGLGFDERQSKDLIESIQMPHGLMLVTGPTGSGKSTTLYACLNLLNEPDTNICTVEDPVEYKFKGMNQVQVKSQVGLTFASALRAFLRQDPDVIMVGEVRDQETAQICLRAALTGHFVLSTIHTNDSLSAVNRLQDMGIEPFLLASTLRVLEAQRLIRRLCKECKEPYECDAETARGTAWRSGATLYRPKGCDQCRGTGYRGRIGVFEVVRITARMASLIQTRAPLPELRTAAREQGMKLLADSGMDKVRRRNDEPGRGAHRGHERGGVERDGNHAARNALPNACRFFCEPHRVADSLLPSDGPAVPARRSFDISLGGVGLATAGLPASAASAVRVGLPPQGTPAA